VPLADTPQAKEKRAVRAVELLRQAVAKGYKNSVHMKKDADFDALRGRDDFKNGVAEAEAAAQPKETKGDGYADDSQLLALPEMRCR
jgi:hypothetical protein